MNNRLVSLKKKDQLGKLFLLFSIGFAFFITRKIFFGQFIQSGDSFWHYSNELHLIKSIGLGKGIFTCLNKGMGLPLCAFYQPLLYILTAGLYFSCLKLISVFFIHNLIVYLLFGLFPISIFYLARSFRFSIFISGLASLFALVPVSGWGHTIDAYFWIGLHTQLLGALFLPVVLGSVHRLTWSKHIYRNIIIAVLTSAGLLMGHAVYAVLAVYSVFIYLILFLIWHGLNRLKNLFRPLLLIIICTGIIVSFWLVPFLKFNSEYKFIPESERSFSPLALSLTVKDTIEAFFSGTLLDTNKLDSPLFGGGEEGFRWSLNDSFYRFKLFTILTALGFLISFFRKKKFRHFFICFMLLYGFFLFCGKDDFPILRFMPFAKNFQPIRAIFLIEISAMLLSAVAIDGIFCFINKKKFHNAIKFILLTLTLLLITPLLFERFFIANIAVNSALTLEQKDLTSLYSKIKNDSGRIYFGKYTGIKKVSSRSLADCFYLNNAIGHDNDMAGSLSWLINDTQKDIPANKDLFNLLAINYLVKKKNWNFPKEQNENVLNNFKIHSTEDIHELLSTKNKTNFSSFAVSKPVLVWCDNITWYYLNRLWINLFLKHGPKISPLVKAPAFFPHLLDDKFFSGAVFINFTSNKSNKKIYYDKLKELSLKKLKIFSNKPLWDIPVKKLVPSKTINFTNFLISNREYKSNDLPETLQTGCNLYHLKTSTEKNRLLITKTAYYNNWTTFIDGKKHDTLWVSPGFIGCLVPAGLHEINIKYIPSNNHVFLLIFAVLSLITIYLLFKKFPVVFKKESAITVFHSHLLKYIKILNKLMILFFICVFALSYIQIKIFKSTNLIYPYDKTKGLNPYEIVFRWNKINDNERYHFQIAEGKNKFDKPLFQVDNHKETSVGYRGLKPYKTYYWRVKPQNGSWSNIYSFKTGNFFPVVIPD